MKACFAFLLVCWLCTGCNQHTSSCAEALEISRESIANVVQHFEDTIMHPASRTVANAFFTRHTTLRERFFNRSVYPSDAIFVNAMYRRFNHAGIDTLKQDVERIFSNFSTLDRSLQEAFAYMQHYYPTFSPPIVQTVITGLETDLYVSKDTILIGVDYYLGPTAHYRPNLYAYLLHRYSRAFIVPSILLLYGIDSQYNHVDPSNHTVLGDMITYGKAYYFAKRMAPCTPDSVFMGYTHQEMIEAGRYESLIWKRLIENEVLYATSHVIKQKYIAERPKTLEVGSACPGRIATWIGWRMVASYMRKHPDTTLPQLMREKDAQKIFNQSGYNPLH